MAATDIEAKIAAERIVNATIIQAQLEDLEDQLAAIRTRARNAGLGAVAHAAEAAHRPVHLATIAARQAAGRRAFAD